MYVKLLLVGLLLLGGCAVSHIETATTEGVVWEGVSRHTSGGKCITENSVVVSNENTTRLGKIESVSVDVETSVADGECSDVDKMKPHKYIREISTVEDVLGCPSIFKEGPIVSTFVVESNGKSVVLEKKTTCR